MVVWPRRSLLIMALVAVVSVAMGVGMTINAQESTSPTRALAASSQSEVSPAAGVPGGPGFFTQPATNCRPTSSSGWWTFSTYELENTGLSPATFECPVSLPHGATINKVVWYYYDNSSTNNLTMALYSLQLDNRYIGLIASSTSTGAQTPYQNMASTSISDPVVDLQSKAYFVEAYLPPDTNVRLVGYRIDYQYGAYLPAVMNNGN